MRRTILIAAACAACVDWTRLSGTVKLINPKDNSVTIEDRDGYLLTIPIDYQTTMTDKHDETRTLKTLELNKKVILFHQIREKPVEDNSGMASPEPSQHGP